MLTRKMIVGMVVAVLVLMSGAAFGRTGVTYYVDADDGNDAWNGLYEEKQPGDNNDGPWETVVRAVKTAEPNDTVYFREGRYPTKYSATDANIIEMGTGTGGAWFSEGADATNRITFKSYPGETATITCMKLRDEPNDWKPVEPNSSDPNLPADPNRPIYYTVLTPQPYPDNVKVNRIPNSSEDGVPLKLVTGKNDNGGPSDLTGPGQWVRTAVIDPNNPNEPNDANDWTLYVWSTDGNNPGTHSTEISEFIHGGRYTIALRDTHEAAWITTEAHYLTFEDLIIEGGFYPVVICTDHIELKNCTIRNCQGDGIKVGGKTTGSPSDPNYWNSEYGLIEDCNIYHFGESGIDITGGDYWIVRDNKIHDSVVAQTDKLYTNGIISKNNSIETLIERNEIYDLDEPSSGISIGGDGIPPAAVNFRVTNNIIYGVPGTYAISFMAAHSCDFSNNLVYGCNLSEALVKWYRQSNISNDALNRDCVVKNNIFYNNQVDNDYLHYEYYYDSTIFGHWRMDDNSNNKSVIDSSLQGHNGTSQQNTEDLHTDGKIDSALDFNGTTDYVDLGNQLYDLKAPYTISMWVNADTISQTSVLMSLDVTDVNSDYAFGLSAGGDKLYLGTSDSNVGLTPIDDYLDAGTWHHWALVFNSNKDITFYLDSNEISLTNVGNYYTAIEQNIGSRNDGSLCFDGKIDDVMIIRKALNEEQVSILYDSGLHCVINMESNYNMVDPCMTYYFDGLGSNLAEWQVIGYDVNSITDTPTFVDLANYDFHLASDSPCIDAGDPNVPNDPNEYNPYDGNEVDFDGFLRASDGDGDGNTVVNIGPYEHFNNVFNTVQKLWYSGIQDAIDEANDGEGLVVCPGTYFEAIDFDGNTITLRSRNPNDWDVIAATSIDVNGGARAVDIDTNSVLTGFTITGGTYGVYCDSASPTVSKCIIEDNSTAGVYCSGGSPEITNNKICDNDSYGIYCSASGATIKNNWMYRNDNTGLRFEGTTSSAPLVRNNTIAYNTLRGIWRLGNATSPTVSNCIIWENNNDLFRCSATYSCIQDNDSGTGNIHDDPVFADVDGNDFHLEPNSPCIDAGNPDGNHTGELDIDFEARVLDADNDGNSVVDMGADEVDYPISHWKFDEGGGSTAYDSSVCGNDGTLNGDPNWTTGKIDGALSFDGDGDYVAVGDKDSLDFGIGSFSISGWFKAPDISATRRLVWKDDGTGYRVYLDSSGKVSVYPRDGSSSLDLRGSADKDDDKWHQFVYVHDAGDTAYIYVDGSSDGSGSLADIGNLTNSDSFTIGAQSDGNLEFNGLIDDVRIYNRALSDEEIEELYQDGLGE